MAMLPKLKIMAHQQHRNFGIFGFLLFAGLLIVLSYSTEIGETLNMSLFSSTLKDYLTYRNGSFCSFTSNGSAPINRIHNEVSMGTATVNATSNCSSSRKAEAPRPGPCPLSSQVLAITQETPSQKQWHADKFWHEADTFPLCTMDTCFNFSLCADMTDFRIYAYGPPYEPSLWYFKALIGSPWLTSDPSLACIFLVIEPQLFDPHPRPHPDMLPYWNGGLNHIIVSFADKWSLTAPPPHTLGNASILATCLYETTYRPGFDISIPLPGKRHFTHLQSLKPWSRKYFLTFKGTRYLGQKEGNFRSDPAFREMHNGEDVIIAVTCNQVTNNRIRVEHPKEGMGCDEDETVFRQYNFDDLMNSTFGLVPAGRQPSSYRMIETLSGGVIPVLIADNYVKPFDTLIQWHQCLLQFPTSESARILFALRAMPREEVERRQRYCLSIYNEYLKDDATLVNSVVKSLKLRFYGMLPQFNEAIKTGVRRRR